MASVCALAACFWSGCGTVPPSPEEAAGKAPEAAADLRYSGKWRIEVSEGANSDGEFVFHVTPKDGETTVVTAEVDDGESENRVARTIRNAFRKQFAAGNYDVEIDDGEDVLIESYGKEPEFALQVISSTVKSVRLRLETE